MGLSLRGLRCFARVQVMCAWGVPVKFGLLLSFCVQPVDGLSCCLSWSVTDASLQLESQCVSVSVPVSVFVSVSASVSVSVCVCVCVLSCLNISLGGGCFALMLS